MFLVGAAVVEFLDDACITVAKISNNNKLKAY